MVKSDIIVRINEARESTGVSLRRLEAITGISRSALNYFENGNVSPTLHELFIIANALNVRITDLFESAIK